MVSDLVPALSATFKMAINVISTMADLHNAMTLDSELCGVRDHRFDGKVHHYRGIPYASVSERFAKPVLATNWRERGPDFKEYGPRCPQPALNVESSMCVPAHIEQNGPAAEDEFACCNLNVFWVGS